MITHYLTEKVSAFLRSRAASTFKRHQIIVYLLHSAIVVIVIMMQLMGLGGSQEAVPQTMSVVHLAACLTTLPLYLFRRLSVPAALARIPCGTGHHYVPLRLFCLRAP